MQVTDVKRQVTEVTSKIQTRYTGPKFTEDQSLEEQKPTITPEQIKDTQKKMEKLQEKVLWTKKEYEEKKKQQREKNPSAQVSQETEDAKIKD